MSNSIEKSSGFETPSGSERYLVVEALEAEKQDLLSELKRLKIALNQARIDAQVAESELRVIRADRERVGAEYALLTERFIKVNSPPKENLEFLQSLVAELAKKPLEGTEIGLTMEFTRKIRTLAEFGGISNPIIFLGEGRRTAIKTFVDLKYGSADGITFMTRNSNLRLSAETFGKHVTEAALKDSGLQPNHYLDHVAMKDTDVINSEKL